MGIPTVETLRSQIRDSLIHAAESSEGLTILETLIAILILSFGLLAMGQLMYAAMGSASLARSKTSASIAAQNKLEFLADLYRHSPSASDLKSGSHGPQQVQVANPVDGTILNRYGISWTVGNVADPRAGKVLPAKKVTLTITPIDAVGSNNSKTFMNKVLSVTAIFSDATP